MPKLLPENDDDATASTDGQFCVLWRERVARFLSNQFCITPILINAQISRLRSGAGGVRVWKYHLVGTGREIACQFSSSNDSDGATSNSQGDDSDFVDSSVIEAIEVKNGSDGFSIKMRDGRYLQCVHNHPRGEYPPDYISHPAMAVMLILWNSAFSGNA